MVHSMNVIIVVFVCIMTLIVRGSSSSDTGTNETNGMTTGSSGIIVGTVTTLNATTFKRMMDENPIHHWFDVIVDVRTFDEYSTTGHLNGSTLVESLASYNTTNQISTPEALRGCDYCNIVVYCRSGSRAAAALQHLINARYKGHLYNGLGVSQWTDEGYPLQMDDTSIIPPCTTNTTISEQCQMTYLSNTSGIAAPTTTTTAPSPSSTTMPRQQSQSQPTPETTTTMNDNNNNNNNNDTPTSDSNCFYDGTTILVQIYTTMFMFMCVVAGMDFITITH